MGKKKEIVLPGDFLSTEEEFSAGKCAFDSDGSIYSGCVGTADADSKAKEINVEPAVRFDKIGVGSIVLGRVRLVKENSVSISMSDNPDREQRQVIAPTSAMLPVRNVSREYVKNLKDFFKIGDIVRAKVSRASPLGIDLATNEPDLGVVKAFCGRCRRPLQVFGTSLKCMHCGSSENRKIAKGYIVK